MLWTDRERRQTMLTSKQAQENQKRYGMNEIREKKKLSIPRVFLEQPIQ